MTLIANNSSSNTASAASAEGSLVTAINNLYVPFVKVVLPSEWTSFLGVGETSELLVKMPLKQICNSSDKNAAPSIDKVKREIVASNILGKKDLTFHLGYRDEDGDLVLLTSDEALKDALRGSSGSKSKIQIFLDKQHKNDQDFKSKPDQDQENLQTAVSRKPATAEADIEQQLTKNLTDLTQGPNAKGNEVLAKLSRRTSEIPLQESADKTAAQTTSVNAARQQSAQPGTTFEAFANNARVCDCSTSRLELFKNELSSYLDERLRGQSSDLNEKLQTFAMQILKLEEEQEQHVNSVEKLWDEFEMEVQQRKKEREKNRDKQSAASESTPDSPGHTLRSDTGKERRNRGNKLYISRSEDQPLAILDSPPPAPASVRAPVPMPVTDITVPNKVDNKSTASTTSTITNTEGELLLMQHTCVLTEKTEKYRIAASGVVRTGNRSCRGRCMICKSKTAYMCAGCKDVDLGGKRKYSWCCDEVVSKRKCIVIHRNNINGVK